MSSSYRVKNRTVFVHFKKLTNRSGRICQLSISVKLNNFPWPTILVWNHCPINSDDKLHYCCQCCKKNPLPHLSDFPLCPIRRRSSLRCHQRREIFRSLNVGSHAADDGAYAAPSITPSSHLPQGHCRRRSASTSRFASARPVMDAVTHTLLLAFFEAKASAREVGGGGGGGGA